MVIEKGIQRERASRWNEDINLRILRNQEGLREGKTVFRFLLQSGKRP